MKTNRRTGNWQNKQIWAVYAEHEDRRMLLDFACGEIEDIASYFDDQKAYGLNLEPVNPIIIEPGYRAKRNELLFEKAQIERRLRTLDGKLTRMQTEDDQ
jgi:hypothetical protein